MGGVEQEELGSPFDLVGHTRTGRLRARPQFQVLDPVVLPIPIPMMNRLTIAQWSPEMLRHNEAVLKNSTAAIGIWMPRVRDHDVSMRRDESSVRLSARWKIKRAVAHKAVVMRGTDTAGVSLPLATSD